ncbi:MAG: HAD family hydrolase [Phycisphaerae bacterium]|nr:HAD family hydrolase [Phycisphaerae bacterium]
MLIAPDKKIKAVLFDLGETLVNFGRINTRQVFRQSAKLTYEFLQSLNQPLGNFEWYCWHSMMAVRLHCLISNLTGKDFNALSLLKKIGIKKGVALSEDQWEEVGWLWYEPLSRLAKVEPDITETLTRLRDMGLKLGIVSNTFINAGSLDRHLREFGMLDFFPCRFYSYQFEFRKPDRRIFQIAAERLNELMDNILFVGDRVDKDIRPAMKADMRAVLKEAYTNAGKKVPKGIHKISRISELPALIEKFNGKTTQADKSVVLSGIE